MIVVSHNDFMHHMVDFGERHTVSRLWICRYMSSLDAEMGLLSDSGMHHV